MGPREKPTDKTLVCRQIKPSPHPLTKPVHSPAHEDGASAELLRASYPSIDDSQESQTREENHYRKKRPTATHRAKKCGRNRQCREQKKISFFFKLRYH